MRQQADPLPELFLIEVRGPRKSLLLWGVLASSSLVSRSNQTLRICAVISAAVAHLVERHLAKVEVASSSLVSRSKKKAPVIDRCFLFGNRCLLKKSAAASILPIHASHPTAEQRVHLLRCTRCFHSIPSIRRISFSSVIPVCSSPSHLTHGPLPHFFIQPATL